MRHPHKQRHRARRPSRASLLRGLAAVLAGVVTGLGYEPIGWWVCVVPGLAALVLLVRSTSRRAAAGLGYLYGLGLFATTISWVSVMGWPVAVLLVIVMACWAALAGWGMRVVAGLPAAPAWQALVWTATEVGAASVPLGGFGWVRLAWTVVDTPWSGILRWVGTVGTTLLVALAACLLAAAVTSGRRPSWRPLVVLAVELLAVTLTAQTALARVPDTTASPRVRVLVVQGGVDGTAGPYALGYARSVTDNHLSQTIMALAANRAAGRPDPDMVLWPENSTDIDPTTDYVTHQLILDSIGLARRPILVGAVTDGPGDDERQTTSLWWPVGADQPTSRYHKRNLVPFGEWIPARSFFLPLIPILQNIGRQSVPGDRPGVLPATLAGRHTRIGVVVCFEVAYDSTVGDTVRNGAGLLTVQSNNSSFTGSGQTPQQWQITRARALETGRHIVVSTTNSYSGLIAPDGTVQVRTPEGGHTDFTVQVPIETGVTAGVRVTPWLRWIVLLLACGAVVVACVHDMLMRSTSRKIGEA